MLTGGLERKDAVVLIHAITVKIKQLRAMRSVIGDAHGRILLPYGIDREGHAKSQHSIERFLAGDPVHPATRAKLKKALEELEPKAHRAHGNQQAPSGLGSQLV